MNWFVVVYDEDYNRKTVSRILNKNVVMVTALGSGEELLGYIITQKNRQDLILLDIAMPALDGVEPL
ncbi:MAG: response regulator, partial [Butyrivibrio sp.]|nr:response regulator [Butyrivibrio sp.]